MGLRCLQDESRVCSEWMKEGRELQIADASVCNKWEPKVSISSTSLITDNSEKLILQ